MQEKDFVQEDFVIDSPGKADWAIRKIKEREAQRDLYISACQETIAEFQQKIQSEKERCESDNANLINLLADYMNTVPVRKTKTQEAFDLPSGQLIRKFAKLDYARDDKKLIDCLRGTDYVEETPKLKWGQLKKTILVDEDNNIIHGETGMMLDGITLVEKPATLLK